MYQRRESDRKELVRSCSGFLVQSSPIHHLTDQGRSQDFSQSKGGGGGEVTLRQSEGTHQV